MAYYEMFINRKKTKKNKGPFIFYEVGGGLVGFGGVTPKKRLKRGGPSQKNGGKGGGGHAKYFSSCRVDMMFYY